LLFDEEKQLKRIFFLICKQNTNAVENIAVFFKFACHRRLYSLVGFKVKTGMFL
jgi:hypothetical protein